VTIYARMSSSDLGVGSCRAEPRGMEHVVPFAWIVPLPETHVSSTSPSHSPLRLTREHLFCLEADGDGPKAGRLGRVIGVGSTCTLSRCVRYSGSSPSTIMGWMGRATSSLAWDSRTCVLLCV